MMHICWLWQKAGSEEEIHFQKFLDNVLNTSVMAEHRTEQADTTHQNSSSGHPCSPSSIDGGV